MKGSLAKKIRKAVNKKTRLDKDEIFKTIAGENLLVRIGYGLKIIFKYKLDKPLEIK